MTGAHREYSNPGNDVDTDRENTLQNLSSDIAPNSSDCIDLKALRIESGITATAGVADLDALGELDEEV